MSALYEHPLPDAGGFALSRRTPDAAATESLGAGAAGLLRGGEILLLHGALGAGKTCFVQGLCRALGVVEDVVSPTFTLVNTYTGGLRVHHLDLYRIGPEHDLDDIGLPDLLDEVWDGAAAMVVEWPTPLLPLLGRADRLELLAEADEDGGRLWRLRGVPAVPEAWRRWFAGEDGSAC